MLKVEFDLEQLEQIIAQAVGKALERHTFKDSLPPLLTRSQLQEVLGIKSTKASELLNRQDFPVIRELGHPRIPTHLLMKWIDENTEWVQANSALMRVI